MTKKPDIFDETDFHLHPQEPKKPFFSQFKKLAIVVAALPVVTSGIIFCWSILGEMFLPEPYRHSTFSGDKEGRRKTHEIHMSMKAEAERQELVTASQSFVQLKQQCQQARNTAAQQMFQQCIIGGVMTGCIYRRDQILALPCDNFLPEDLSTQFKKLVKNGESHD
jgi:hypothetical protein